MNRKKERERRGPERRREKRGKERLEGRKKARERREEEGLIYGFCTIHWRLDVWMVHTLEC